MSGLVRKIPGLVARNQVQQIVRRQMGGHSTAPANLPLMPEKGLDPFLRAELKKWILINLFITAPALTATAVYTLNEEHEGPPEYREYAHLRIRTKPFPWRDGNHSLFHHRQMNAIPGVGYEEEFHH